MILPLGDGWYAERLTGGGVRITLRDRTDSEHSEVVGELDLSDSEWVALIAQMTGRKDLGIAVMEASALHHGGSRET